MAVPIFQDVASYAAAQGYTQMEDGRYQAPDGESFVDTSQLEAAAPSQAQQLSAAGYLPIGAGGMTQDTLTEINKQHGTNFATPVDYLSYVYGGGKVVDDPNGVYGQLFETPTGDATKYVNQPLSYQAPNTWADVAFPAAFVALTGMAFLGPASMGGLDLMGAGAATEGAAASAGAAGWSDPLIGQAVAGSYAAVPATTAAGIGAGDALAGTALAGTTAAGIGGTATGALANAVGGGLINSGADVAAAGAVAPAATPVADTAGTLTQAQIDATNVAQDLVYTPNYTDPWATGTAEAVANSGIAGDTGIGMLTNLVKDPVTNAIKTAAQAAVKGADPNATPWDKVWNAITSDKGTSALITGGMQVLGGMGVAALNSQTLKDKAALDLSNTQALMQSKVDLSKQNMFKGLINVNPAAVRAPLQRLTGGSVYTPSGLLRRA